jgi:hypothetical protein
MEDRLLEWGLHNRRMKQSAAYRQGFEAAQRLTRSAIPLGVRQSLARFVFGPDPLAECEHVVRIKTGNGWKCRACDADYRTPEWRALRRQVLERERGLCQLCGGVANDAHHETYRFGVLCPPEFLTALCHRCHLAEHGRVPSVGTREFTSDRPVTPRLRWRWWPILALGMFVWSHWSHRAIKPSERTHGRQSKPVVGSASLKLSTVLPITTCFPESRMTNL